MADEVEVPAEVAEVQEEAPAEEAIDETVAEAPAEVTPPPPRKKTAQERIDEITRARREAEREREFWKNEALKGREEKPPEPSRPSLGPSRPTLDQFETTVAYEDALLNWHERKKEVETQVTRQQVAHDESLRTFNQRSRKLREENEDFDEVIEAPVFSPVMRLALLNSENGPAVAYHLGRPENRDEADRIRRLPIEMQPYELGKLETKLLLIKQTKKVSGAPPPIKPVGMAGGSPEVDTSKMTTAEWMEWDKQRTMEKLKGKYGGP